MSNDKAPSFEDHFSKHSRLYSQYRSQYPREIYAYLVSIAPGSSLAWDCGTGNGQAALGLAEYFEKVFADEPKTRLLRWPLHFRIGRNEADL